MTVPKEKVYAVIMAGGKGERLWPLSTEERPKPLISLNGNQTLLEETVQRLFPLLLPENIIVVANETSVDQFRKILPIPVENIIAEPCRRNTAPCVALATALIRRRTEDAVIIMLPADHKIFPVKSFQKDLAACVDNVEYGNLLILGVLPNFPATGYGYAKIGEEIAPGFYKVVAFREKPDEKTARNYVMSGDYCWNCGIFIWTAAAITESFKRYYPALFEKIEVWVGGKDFQDDFAECDEISFDYAVMEKAENVVVKLVSFYWSDIGSFRSIYNLCDKDEYGNAICAQGRVIVENSDLNLIVCDDDTEIRLHSLRKYAVIKSGKRLLISEFPE